MTETQPFRHILIAFDATGPDTAALQRGFALARDLKARCEVLHVLDSPSATWPGSAPADAEGLETPDLGRAREECLRWMEQPREDSAYPGPSNEALLQISSGNPAREILHAAESKRCDLILLGPHARRSSWDFGNTTRAVLSRSDIPVWRQSGPTGVVRRILVPVDFSDHVRAAMRLAHSLAMQWGASVRLLHCHEAPPLGYMSADDLTAGSMVAVAEERRAAEADLARWREEFDWDGVTVETSFVESPPMSGIVAAAEDVDLIVMGSHGRTGLSRFLLGSVAYGAVKHTPRPVLVVPQPQRRWLLDEPASSLTHGIPEVSPDDAGALPGTSAG